ncbi:MAG: Nif3-like dinuclear metal center hexameric protein [Gemmatimonadota bacterium]
MSGAGAELAKVVAYLDTYLRIREVPDDSNALNGLQVENSGTVRRIVAAVDASQATFDGLGSSGGPPLLLVHHGMFWDGNQPVVGRRYRRLHALLAFDAAVYAAHIPLDLHPEVGNNAILARRLGLTDLVPFGTHKGVAIGLAGKAPTELGTRTGLVNRLAAILKIPSNSIRLIPGGTETVLRIGVITGGAGSAIAQAQAAGCDAYVTGEGAAHTYFDAMELGLNVLYAGHYATETIGVQALAAHLAERFGLPWEFHDHPTGM